MEENHPKLYVPANIKTKFQFFDGFGFSELAVTLVTTLISMVIGLIIYSFWNDFYKSVLIVLVTLSATVMAVRKNEINQSVVDMIKLYIRFIKSQKVYKYVYKNKYYDIENSKENTNLERGKK